MVVEVEIAVDPTPLLFRGGVVVQADLFVLPREPGLFGQNVVQRPPFDQLLAMLNQTKQHWDTGKVPRA